MKLIRGFEKTIELPMQNNEVFNMIKTIDLFAGAGGLSLGFLMTGKYQIVAAAEINKNARETYKTNIAKDNDNFEFIENVIDYDFSTLNSRFENSIDVVIGGPPCQGFSNANRQKNHLISMNNSLVKEYFRAIRQIRPKAFVMENVSMLESETHRFYESRKDNDEIDALIANGYDIPKRMDTLVLSKVSFDGIDMCSLPESNLREIFIPKQLTHLLSVLQKNINNPRRLPNFLLKNKVTIEKLINSYICSEDFADSTAKQQIISKLETIKYELENSRPEKAYEELDYLVSLQKVIASISEIIENELIGNYEYSAEDGLRFIVNSYSVIDYINAILGDEYIQKGNVFNAKWFGVPQERRRYIVVGIRRDIYIGKGIDLNLPNETIADRIPTVGEAILDLSNYEVGYKPHYTPIPYVEKKGISSYARSMRKGSKSVKNHITTKTTDKALERFKKIKQGKNFHSLGIEDKDTYSKPERTQNTIYLRLDPNKPSGTVVNVRKSMWIHPILDRAITVREAARLQSFPDSFEFIGTKDSQYQQVGNAVPPLLAKGIADLIFKYLQ